MKTVLLIEAKNTLIISPAEGQDYLKKRCHCTIVWLHCLDSIGIPGEKTRWELNKEAACCFEQILEAAPHKTAAVRPLTSHLTKHSNNTSKTCWVLLAK